jgi:hypothetical protein
MANMTICHFVADKISEKWFGTNYAMEEAKFLN